MYGWWSFDTDTLIDKAEFLKAKDVNLEGITETASAGKERYKQNSYYEPETINVSTSPENGVFDVYLIDETYAEIRLAYIVEYPDNKGEQNPAYLEDVIYVTLNN